MSPRTDGRLTRKEYLSLAQLVASRVCNKARIHWPQYTLGQLRADLASDLHEGFANWILGHPADRETWNISELPYEQLRAHIEEALLAWEPPAQVLGCFRTHRPCRIPPAIRYIRLLDAILSRMSDPEDLNFGNISRAFRRVVRPLIMEGDITTARTAVKIAHDFRLAHLRRTHPEY